MAGEQERIGAAARKAITADETKVAVSAVSIWEVAIKRGLGKLDAPEELVAQLERAGVELLAINARHAERVGSLPPHHRDPFDRLLVAQAEIEGLAIATGDEKFGLYGVTVIWD